MIETKSPLPLAYEADCAAMNADPEVRAMEKRLRSALDLLAATDDPAEEELIMRELLERPA